MITVIVVLELIAILAHAALPITHSTRLRMKATDIAREMSQVRSAAESARQQRGAWPEDVAPGSTPQELTPFLPPGFKFVHEGYEFDWEHWPLTQGGSLGAGSHELAGVTVITTDPRLAGMVARMLREGEMRLTLGNRTTLVIAEPAVAGR